MSVASKNHKRVVITGHTRGIGSALTAYFKEKNWTVNGFSKSQGMDISASSTQDKILEACQDAHIFVNNAHSDFAQVELLYKVFDQWQDENKWIINLCTDMVPANQWEVVYKQYSVEKIALHSASVQLQQQKRKCRILNLRLNHVSTDTYESNDQSIKQLELKDMVDVLDWILGTPQHVEIKEITLAAL